jgi:hypothetical protein
MGVPDLSAGRGSQESVPGEKWSMLVPKAQAGARTRASLAALHEPNASSRPPTDASEATGARAASSAHLRFSRSETISHHGLDARRAVRFVLTLVVAIVALSFWTMSRLGASLAAPTMSFSSAKGHDWFHDRARVSPRARLSRNLVLYRPFTSRSDYRLLFEWRPDAGGVGCIFRARDSRNYQMAKLSLVPGGVSLERFTVIDGVQDEPLHRMVTLQLRDPEPEVAIEAIGSVFALYVQDELVDTWHDQRLPSGAVGFVEGHGSVPARAIRLTLLKPPFSQNAGMILLDALRSPERWWRSVRDNLAQ